VRLTSWALAGERGSGIGRKLAHTGAGFEAVLRLPTFALVVSFAFAGFLLFGHVLRFNPQKYRTEI
jgi:hypothetical protein